MNAQKTIFPLFFNKARFTQAGIDRIIDVIMQETMDNCDNKPILSSKFAIDSNKPDDKMEAVAYGAMSKNNLPYFKITVKPDTYRPDAQQERQRPVNAPQQQHGEGTDFDDDIPF